MTLTGLKDGLELTQTGRKIRFRKRNRGIGKTELGYLNTLAILLTLVGPGSAPTTGYIENDAMKLRRGTKEFYKPCFQWMGCRFQCKTMKLNIPTALSGKC
jgi:hypothetical protein